MLFVQSSQLECFINDYVGNIVKYQLIVNI